MQGRAVKVLEGVHKKAKIEDEEAYSKNAYKLLHYHIEAFDSKIVLNKIDLDDQDGLEDADDIGAFSDAEELGRMGGTVSSKFQTLHHMLDKGTTKGSISTKHAALNQLQRSHPFS